jgi:hypothetical protein
MVFAVFIELLNMRMRAKPVTGSLRGRQHTKGKEGIGEFSWQGLQAGGILVLTLKALRVAFGALRRQVAGEW